MDAATEVTVPSARRRSGRAAATRRIVTAVQRGIDIALQPIVDLDSGDVTGVEALARFDDGRAPDAWFAEAASLGLGTALELAAVEAAIHRIRELPSGASLSVNVSAATVCSPQLGEILARAPRGRVVLEITEHAPVGDYAALTAALEVFRAGGVRLAIDDAGAGFASMRHVVRLRPDVVKIDASLVRGIDSEPAQRALVAALVQFADATGCSLVAEGVETAAELDAARALGVASAQGFHLGRPEAAGPPSWQVTLPRRLLRPMGPVARARFLRPASLVVAAALSWPGILVLAGAYSSGPAPAIRTPSATSAPRAVAPEPAGPAEPVAAPERVPEAARKVEEPAPAVQHSPSRGAPPASPRTPGLVEGVVDEVVGVTEELTESITTTVGGLLRRVLGR